MAFDYQAMADMAQTMLGPEEFGSPFILMKPDGEEELDPETLMMTQGWSEHTGVGVMKQYSAEMIGALSNIIQAGDTELICRTDDGSVPVEGEDKVVFGGTEYNVLSVGTLNPSGSLVLLYKVQLRRAGDGNS